MTPGTKSYTSVAAMLRGLGAESLARAIGRGDWFRPYVLVSRPARMYPRRSKLKGLAARRRRTINRYREGGIRTTRNAS